MNISDAMLDRFFHLIDQFSFEWDGVLEENPEDSEVKEISEKAQEIYDKIDEIRSSRMKEK